MSRILCRIILTLLYQFASKAMFLLDKMLYKQSNVDIQIISIQSKVNKHTRESSASLGTGCCHFQGFHDLLLCFSCCQQPCCPTMFSQIGNLEPYEYNRGFYFIPLAAKQHIMLHVHYSVSTRFLRQVQWKPQKRITGLVKCKACFSNERTC